MDTPYKPEGDGCVPALPGYERKPRPGAIPVPAPYDYRTPEYETYVRMHLDFVAGLVTQEDRDAALQAAQEAAAEYQNGAS